MAFIIADSSTGIYSLKVGTKKGANELQKLELVYKSIEPVLQKEKYDELYFIVNGHVMLF